MIPKDKIHPMKIAACDCKYLHYPYTLRRTLVNANQAEAESSSTSHRTSLSSQHQRSPVAPEAEMKPVGWLLPFKHLQLKRSPISQNPKRQNTSWFVNSCADQTHRRNVKSRNCLLVETMHTRTHPQTQTPLTITNYLLFVYLSPGLPYVLHTKPQNKMFHATASQHL